MRGESVVRSGRHTDDSCFAELLRVTRLKALKPNRVQTLHRILLGESQKVDAHDLGVGLSSVAGACGDCLLAIGAGRWASRAPVWLVMAAHAGAGLRLPTLAVRQLGEVLDVSCPRPDAWLETRLTRAE